MNRLELNQVQKCLNTLYVGVDCFVLSMMSLNVLATLLEAFSHVFPNRLLGEPGSGMALWQFHWCHASSLTLIPPLPPPNLFVGYFPLRG